MKSAISQYGWLVITIIILAILVSLASPLAIHIKDSVIRIFQKQGEVMPNETNTSRPYLVALRTNEPKNSTVVFTSDGHNGSKLILQGQNTITATATCEKEYRFIGWYKGNTLLSDNPVYTWTVTGSQTIDGRFQKAFGMYESNSNYSNIIYDWDELINAGIVDNSGRVVPGKELLLSGDLNVEQNITTIHENSYFLCTDLTGVMLPENITKINNSAFNSCTKLNFINIPNGVIYIGDAAFNSCTKLAKIEIPNTVLSIGKHAFATCTSLKTVVFESDSNLQTINDYAFNSCTELINVVLPSRVTSLSKGSFGNCENLSVITIPNSVKAIGENAFYRCISLKTIIFDGTVEQWNNIQFGDNWDSETGNYYVKCTDGIVNPS